MDIKKKPYRLVMGGENQDIFVFDGVPFKPAKTLHSHTHFVNQLVFNQDGSQFVSVSSDKTIVLHDSNTLEPIQKIDKAHGKGVMDALWLNESTVMTCSTDNTIKTWNIKDGKEIK